MNNKLLRKHGFTLVELMIVIAIIALLMLVLYPRFGTLKNKTKESGIKQNILMLEGIIQAAIDEYEISEIAAFETRIAADINAATSAQRIKNPMTGDVGTVENTDIDDGAAVVYSTDDDSFADKADVFDGTTAIPAAEGMIAFVAYPSGTKIAVDIIPYGVGGAVMLKSKNTIVQ